MVVSIYISTNSARVFIFPTPAAFIVCRLFDDGHSDQCELISHCRLDLHFSNNEHPRSGVAAKRSNPTFKERWLRGCRRAERSYSMLKVSRGGHEEIPLIQGKEQQLRFAGAAVKRYPKSKVRETQVRG